ncbi:MAG: hypothetical protein NT062_06840 [Proteobacteria bacterium]|nr:hypothetical protein [Pseudomonadota bacterium]
MAISDAQFRGAVIAGAIIVVATIGGVRFFGSVGIPDKANVVAPTGTSTELLTRSAATTNVYLELLAKDATLAGVPAPTLESMTKKFPYSQDEQRHMLEVGQPATSIVGLALRAQHAGDAIVLEIQNTSKQTLAYHIVTQVIPATICDQARPLPVDAIVIAGESTIVRTECVWRDDAVIAVTKVETMELPPISAYLVGQVPPVTLGIEPNTAHGHHLPATHCTANISRNVQSELEKGSITWRDLVDFYARHRCQTYQFIADYRALNSDGQRAIPAVSDRN